MMRSHLLSYSVDMEFSVATGVRGLVLPAPAVTVHTSHVLPGGQDGAVHDGEGDTHMADGGSTAGDHMGAGKHAPTPAEVDNAIAAQMNLPLLEAGNPLMAQVST
jgi:hypothetical protein